MFFVRANGEVSILKKSLKHASRLFGFDLVLLEGVQQVQQVSTRQNSCICACIASFLEMRGVLWVLVFRLLLEQLVSES